MTTVNLFSKEKQTRNGGMTNCPICGKPVCILTTKNYAYKAVNKNGFVRYMCSWKCFNEACTKISNSKAG